MSPAAGGHVCPMGLVSRRNTALFFLNFCELKLPADTSLAALTPGPDAATSSSIDGRVSVPRLSTPEPPEGELVCVSPEQWPESSVRSTTTTLGSPMPEAEPVLEAQPMSVTVAAVAAAVVEKSSLATSEKLTPMCTPEKAAVPKAGAPSKQPAPSKPPKAMAKSKAAATNTPTPQPLTTTVPSKRGRKRATTASTVPTTSSPLRNRDEHSGPSTRSKRARISH